MCIWCGELARHGLDPFRVETASTMQWSRRLMSDLLKEVFAQQCFDLQSVRKSSLAMMSHREVVASAIAMQGSARTRRLT